MAEIECIFACDSCYMVCFDFGAVVFCNTKDLDVIGQQLVHARGFCERPLEEPSAEECVHYYGCACVGCVSSISMLLAGTRLCWILP
mgnify:CR=1 FL=1